MDILCVHIGCYACVVYARVEQLTLKMSPKGDLISSTNLIVVGWRMLHIHDTTIMWVLGNHIASLEEISLWLRMDTKKICVHKNNNIKIYLKTYQAF